MMSAEDRTQIWRCAACGSLQKMTDLGRELMGCAVLLGDPSLSVLAASCGTNCDDWNWEQHTQAGFAPEIEEAVAFEGANRLFFSKSRHGWRGVMKKSGRYYALLDLHSDDDKSFHLVISHEEEETITKLLPLIDLYCEAFQVLIRRRLNEIDSQLSIGQFFTRLLEGRHEEDSVMATRAQLLQIPLEGIFTLLTIDLRGYSPTKPSLFDLGGQLERLFNCVSAVYEHNLVALLHHSSDADRRDKRNLDAIEKLLKSAGLLGARSRCFFTLKDVPLHYQQTKDMLRLAPCVQHGPLLDFFTMAPYLLADKLPQQELQDYAIHPFIRQLLLLDQDSKFSYIETLKAYLDAGMNAPVASRKLCIHNNTMDYRLRRINKLTDIDWTNGSLMFQLYFSIIQLEMAGRIRLHYPPVTE